LPDGLLEVRLGDEADEDLFLLEVTTYPERRVSQQMTDDLLLVYLDRGQLPEGVTLVLRPRQVPRPAEPQPAQPPWVLVVPSELARRGVVDDPGGRASAGRGCRPNPVGTPDGFRRPARDDASAVSGIHRTARTARRKSEFTGRHPSVFLFAIAVCLVRFAAFRDAVVQN
jgi:hypothetical protein